MSSSHFLSATNNECVVDYLTFRLHCRMKWGTVATTVALSARTSHQIALPRMFFEMIVVVKRAVTPQHTQTSSPEHCRHDRRMTTERDGDRLGGEGVQERDSFWCRDIDDKLRCVPDPDGVSGWPIEPGCENDYGYSRNRGMRDTSMNERFPPRRQKQKVNVCEESADHPCPRVFEQPSAQHETNQCVRN